MNEFELNIGARVHCQDGECGKLAKIAVDPDVWQVTHLIAEEGFLLKRDRAFPISIVERATAEDIYLTIRAEELTSYPEYREEHIERPADQATASAGGARLEATPYMTTVAPPIPMVRERVRYGVSAELAVIERGTPIQTQERTIGKLDHVLALPEDGAITHLVIRRGTLFTHQEVVPISMVEHIGERSIALAVSEEELGQLPQDIPQGETRPEETVGAEVAGKRPVGEMTGGAEMSLTSRVTAALMADPRTSKAVIEVIEEHGVVTLAGQVDSPKTREAAQAIAASQPGVISVVNTLQVPKI
ncbi:MAG: BON domain-containing protein [Chloroflexi bacterium]|nr:BON domain-containing protein [Chloroflexota bacterium]MCI0580234.1 BON domain-containing protein [Chloroflexota bacterium]MCI0646905.1 BON domain-containing protein [Chloroflexota bacterium]MCI0729090.1 BON domain-containing protein [Chloroflexota bacterium]